MSRTHLWWVGFEFKTPVLTGCWYSDLITWTTKSLRPLPMYIGHVNKRVLFKVYITCSWHWIDIGIPIIFQLKIGPFQDPLQIVKQLISQFTAHYCTIQWSQNGKYQNTQMYLYVLCFPFLFPAFCLPKTIRPLWLYVFNSIDILKIQALF